MNKVIFRYNIDENFYWLVSLVNTGSPEPWAFDIKHQKNVNCIVQINITNAFKFFLAPLFKSEVEPQI